MPSLRVRISTLMAFILLCGMIAAMARFFDEEVAVVFGGLLLVLGVLGSGILGVVYRRGEKRAFWVGFTVFGWSLVLPLMVLLQQDMEFLLFAPAVPPFAWIGGAIARGFARGSDNPPQTGVARGDSNAPPADVPHPLDVA